MAHTVLNGSVQCHLPLHPQHMSSVPLTLALNNICSSMGASRSCMYLVFLLDECYSESVCVLVCADEGVHVHWCMCGRKSRKSVNKLISDLS